MQGLPAKRETGVEPATFGLGIAEQVPDWL